MTNIETLMREMEAKINSLQSEKDTLQASNEALKERVKQLEAALGKISNCFGLTLGKADAGKFTRIAKAALQVTTIK